MTATLPAFAHIPLHDYVVVVPIAVERKRAAAGNLDIDLRMSAGGVALPDTADADYAEGRVVAVADGYLAPGCPTCDPGGVVKHHFEVRVGDRVVWTPWAAITVTLEGVEYNFLRESALLGIVEEVNA